MQTGTALYSDSSSLEDEKEATVSEIIIPFFFGNKLIFGLAHMVGKDKMISKLFFFKTESKPPRNIDDTCTKRMIAVQITNNRNRIRIGFIKRRQTIMKIG